MSILGCVVIIIALYILYMIAIGPILTRHPRLSRGTALCVYFGIMISILLYMIAIGPIRTRHPRLSRGKAMYINMCLRSSTLHDESDGFQAPGPLVAVVLEGQRGPMSIQYRVGCG